MLVPTGVVWKIESSSLMVFSHGNGRALQAWQPDIFPEWSRLASPSMHQSNSFKPISLWFLRIIVVAPHAVFSQFHSSLTKSRTLYGRRIPFSTCHLGMRKEPEISFYDLDALTICHPDISLFLLAHLSLTLTLVHHQGIFFIKRHALKYQYFVSFKIKRDFKLDIVVDFFANLSSSVRGENNCRILDQFLEFSLLISFHLLFEGWPCMSSF